MNENNENNVKKSSFTLKTLLIFGAVMILLCFFIFIFNYNVAFDEDAQGGYIPPSFAVVFYYFILTVIALITAIIIKAVFQKRVSLCLLLAVTLLVPIVSYKVNRATLHEDGPLYFLVDEGGIFRFIAIGDYNFDGMNDKVYHRTYDTRTVSTTYGGYPSDIIKAISTKTTGVGYHLDAFNFYDEEKSEITLHFNRDNVVYDEIQMIITFRDPDYPNRFNMTLVSQNDHGWMKPVDYQIDYEYKVNGNNTLSVIFDAEDCRIIQSQAPGEFIELLFSFSVE